MSATVYEETIHEVWIDAPVTCGVRYLSPDEAKRAKEDPDGFAAACFETDVHTFLRWKEAGGCPRCGAKTKAGRPCRMTICGPVWPEDWMRLDRSDYCPTHGGASKSAVERARPRAPPDWQQQIKLRRQEAIGVMLAKSLAEAGIHVSREVLLHLGETAYRAIKMNRREVDEILGSGTSE